MHSRLAVTLNGTPLGLTAVKFWTRTKFKGTLALKRHINPTRVPIETKESFRWLGNFRQSIALVDAPERCVHVGDRESDIYELYCTAQGLGTNFLVRVQTNRLAGRPADAAPHNPAHRVFAQLAAAPWAGRHRITVDQDKTTWLQVKFAGPGHGFLRQPAARLIEPESEVQDGREQQSQSDGRKRCLGNDDAPRTLAASEARPVGIGFRQR